MKKIFLYKKGKVKSLDIRNSSNLKNKIINNTESNNKFSNNIPSVNDGISRKNMKKGEEISILSNANLNILRRLSTFALAEILNNSTDFQNVNKKKILNLRSIDNSPKFNHKIINNKIRVKWNINKNSTRKSLSISSSSLNSSEFSLNSYKIMSKLKTKKLPSFIKKIKFEKVS